jgi:hypothetical protein
MDVPLIELGFTTEVPLIESGLVMDVPLIELGFTIEVPLIELGFATEVPLIESGFAMDVPLMELGFTIDVPLIEVGLATEVPLIDMWSTSIFAAEEVWMPAASTTWPTASADRPSFDIAGVISTLNESIFATPMDLSRAVTARLTNTSVEPAT